MAWLDGTNAQLQRLSRRSVRPPQDGQIGLARSAPPQPQALGDARLTRQALDLDQHQGAPHGGLRPPTALGGMVLAFGVDANPGADADRAVLRMLLAVLARGSPPGALLGAGELLAMPPWPPNLRTDRGWWIGIEAAVAAQPHQHGDLLAVEFH